MKKQVPSPKEQTAYSAHLYLTLFASILARLGLRLADSLKTSARWGTKIVLIKISLGTYNAKNLNVWPKFGQVQCDILKYLRYFMSPPFWFLFHFTTCRRLPDNLLNNMDTARPPIVHQNVQILSNSRRLQLVSVLQSWGQSGEQLNTYFPVQVLVKLQFSTRFWP